MAALASLFALPKPSAKLYTESERLAAAGASAEPITEALGGEHRGNDFLFSSIREEYVSVTGFEGAESSHCKLWGVETELYSCPLTSVTWSHSSGLQASTSSPKSHSPQFTAIWSLNEGGRTHRRFDWCAKGPVVSFRHFMFLGWDSFFEHPK